MIYNALTGKVTSEKMAALEKEFAKVTAWMQQQDAKYSHIEAENVDLRHRLSSVEAGALRYEDAEASAAGTRMVQKRWANRDRARLLQ